MTTRPIRWVAAALALLVMLAGVAPAAAQSDGQTDGRADWAAATYDDLALLAERYNASLEDGANPRLTGERVTLRVTSDGDGAGSSAGYAFVLSRSGHITDLRPGEHPDPTLVLTTSRGTVRYLATAPDPVAAFASVFGRLGDVQGPGVEARDGRYVLLGAFPKVWKTYVVVPTTIEGEGENATLRLTVNEEGVEEEAGEKPEKKGTGVIDLRGEKPTARSLPGSDVDGDGYPDVVTVTGRDVPPGIVRIDASESLRSDGTRGIEKTDIKRGMVQCPDDGRDADRPAHEWEWGQLRCDGSVDLEYLDPDDDGDGLYVVLADGRKIVRDVGKKKIAGTADDASADDVNDALRMKAKEKANKTKCNNSLREGTDGDGGADENAPACEDLVVEITYGNGDGGEAIAVRTAAGELADVPADSTLVRTLGDGDLSSVEVYHAVTFGEPEPIEPIDVRGVGLVNGLKWAVIRFLMGFGLF